MRWGDRRGEGLEGGNGYSGQSRLAKDKISEAALPKRSTSFLGWAFAMEENESGGEGERDTRECSL